MHASSFGDFLYFWSSIAFNVGILVSMIVTFRRSQAVVRRRVQRTGRPVPGVFIGVQLVWCFLKSLVWPVNLIAWLLLGRPRPGTYFRESRSSAGEFAPAGG